MNAGVSAGQTSNQDRTFVHRIVRYTPNALRDEWINIGVLVFDPETGERRLRLIEDEEEYRRLRRLIPRADEALIHNVRDDLEHRLDASAQRDNAAEALLDVLKKWDETLTGGVHFAEPKGTVASDLDAEMERLYAQRVAVPRVRAGLAGDFAYRRNGTRGFVQTLSVTRAPGDSKLLAYTSERIREKAARRNSHVSPTLRSPQITDAIVSCAIPSAT